MEEYEIKFEQNKKRNEKFLKIFEKWLTEKNLTERTINKHILNVDLYINEFLNYYDIEEMEQGTIFINRFLGDWFIRKCLWATKASIKNTASSIKKFYQCMLEKGFINSEDYKFLAGEIKGNMEDWILELEAFDNFDEDDFF